MPEPWGYMWLCAAGHESAHSELAIRSLTVQPRCPLRYPDGHMCWEPLVRRVCALPDFDEAEHG